MTDTSGSTPGPIHTQPALNYAAIRARAADLGMHEEALNELTGITLSTLERDPDQRGIGLSLLTQLARVLDLSLDDLVAADEPPTLPAQPVRQGDDIILLALLASYGGLSTQRLLDLLDWTAERLDSALATIGTHLAPTVLRVAVTDHRLTLTLRPGALPTAVRERFDTEQSLREPLDPSTAVELLKLVRDKILAPFPEEDGRFPGEERRPTWRHTWTEEFLISSRLAIDVAPGGGDSGAARLEVHPDVMFALRLSGLDESGPAAAPTCSSQQTLQDTRATMSGGNHLGPVESPELPGPS
jgi:hypothetical protein